MIDVEWLKTIQFETDYGHVTGLAGLGSQWIVFKLRASGDNQKFGKDIGEDAVLKILNTPRLGFHICEIPPDLESKPTYDAARVNRKLRAQVGNPLFDSMVGPYNGLYESVIATLHRGGLDAIRSMIDDEDAEAIFAFFLNTPGVRRRLEDAAFLDAGGNPREIVTWNGVLHPIEEPRGTVAAWARSMLKELNAIVAPEGYEAAKLYENPFWIWGGAVLDGFFTSEEMAEAAQSIAASFGNPAEGPDGARLRFEMFAFLSLLSLVVERDELRRLTDFCNYAGFGFSMADPKLEEEQNPERAAEEMRGAKMPKLSPPSLVPKFPEEGRIDPMAQDCQLLRAAATLFSDFTVRLATAAHAAGIAVMLPRAENEADVHWKPWRSVVPVQDSASTQAPVDNEPSTLWLTQRLLASTQAVAARTGVAAQDGMAELIEAIGYVAIGRSYDVGEQPKLNACRSLGALAAISHRRGYIHGDLQPENFKFKEDGGIAGMFDLGRTCNPGRPLTLLERTSDLAVLKKHVTFLEWEAAKLGYRSEALDADKVLAQFEQE
jgi:hypothetical protein